MTYGRALALLKGGRLEIQNWPNQNRPPVEAKPGTNLRNDRAALSWGRDDCLGSIAAHSGCPRDVRYLPDRDRIPALRARLGSTFVIGDSD